MKEMTIETYVGHLAVNLEVAKRYRLRDARETVLGSLKHFYGEAPLQLKELYTQDFLIRYQEYLLSCDLARNTISSYMGILRSIYHTAVQQKLLPYTLGLFSGVFTGLEPTKKRAASSNTINTLIDSDLSDRPELEFYRDLFLFSFYCQGMSFVDMAYLRKSDVQEDLIVYYRRKSGSMVAVAIGDEVYDIMAKYEDATANSPYVFPIVFSEDEAGRNEYLYALHKMNLRLKEIARHLGIKETLTSYVARHSWATIAYHSKVAIGVVSQAMGHRTEEVTRIYLASFDKTELFKANQAVLKAVRGKKVSTKRKAIAVKKVDENAEVNGATVVSSRKNGSELPRSTTSRKNKKKRNGKGRAVVSQGKELVLPRKLRKGKQRPTLI